MCHRGFVFNGAMGANPAPLKEHSCVRVRVPKVDDKGRSVAVGAEGVIVHIHEVPAGQPPAYIVEVILFDKKGVHNDSHLFDALHSEVEVIPH